MHCTHTLYYMATGEPDLALAFTEQMHDRTMVKFMDNKTGVLETDKMGRHITDWMPDTPTSHGETDETVQLGEFTASKHMSVSNGFAAQGLNLLAQMMTAGGRTENATKFAAESASLMKGMKEAMWNGTINGTNWCDGICTEVKGASLMMSNMFMLNFGMVPTAHVDSAWKVVADWGLEKIGDYGSFWYFGALASGYYAPYYDTPDDGSAIYTALTKCDRYSWCSGLRDDNLTMTRESWHQVIHTLYSYTVLIHCFKMGSYCTHTLYSYTVVILYPYTVLILYSYTVLILYSYCTHTVLILYSCCTHTVLILYSYCTHTLLILYAYCTHTVLILYSYCTHTVLILYSCCTHAVLMLYSYCTHTLYSYTVLILYSYTVLIHCTHTLYSYCTHTLYSYCTHTLYSLYSYCTHTVLTIYCTQGTYSHQWGTSAIVGVVWGLMGVHQTAPGWSSFTVKPKLGGLLHASITVPTLRGYINVTAEPGAVAVGVPCNTIATLCVPRSAQDATLYTPETHLLLLDGIEVSAVATGTHLCASEPLGCGPAGAPRRLSTKPRS
jgi:hypothetical protein